MDHRDEKIAAMSASILVPLIASGAVAPTSIERAFRLVQSDPKGLSAINKMLPLAMTYEKSMGRMATIDAAVEYYMGVIPIWNYAGEDYYICKADEAVPDARVRKNPEILTPLKRG